MKIRPMNIEDCEAVSRIFLECFSDPWSLDGVKEMFSVDGYLNFVLTDNQEELVGYIGCKQVLDEADITNVAVKKSAQGHGYATKLLAHFLEEVQKAGVAVIFLEVRASNTVAIRLYEHAGFIRTGLRKNYYDNPKEDAVLMIWSPNEKEN